MLSIAQRPSRVADLLTQFLQVTSETGFERIGAVAAAEVIRAALHAGAKSVVVHAVERAPHLARSSGLRGGKLARLRAHFLSEVRQVVAHALAIADHFV